MSVSKGLLQLYAELEEPLHRALKKYPISCKKGCDHCCYMMTLCGVQEGLLMADAAMSSMAWRYYVRELRQSAKAMIGCTQAEYFQKRRPCVFLKDNLCEVYEVRPSACRFYYVVSPPEDCSPDKNGKKVLAANTSMQESMVWKYERIHSPGGVPVFAPLPLMVLHSCLVVAMARGKKKKALYVKRHLNNMIDPITWLESVDVEKMSRNTPETREAYREAGEAVGILHKTGGIYEGQEVLDHRGPGALQGVLRPGKEAEAEE
jgi:Fe-S-cluster containining protein